MHNYNPLWVSLHLQESFENVASNGQRYQLDPARYPPVDRANTRWVYISNFPATWHNLFASKPSCKFTDYMFSPTFTPLKKRRIFSNCSWSTPTKDMLILKSTLSHVRWLNAWSRDDITVSLGASPGTSLSQNKADSQGAWHLPKLTILRFHLDKTNCLVERKNGTIVWEDTAVSDDLSGTKCPR